MNTLAKRMPIFLILLYLFFFLFLFDLCLKAQENPEGGQFNVLLITVDTLRPDRLSCYQSPYLKTPNIDSLAERGLLFTRAFAHTTTTLPSHTNILLGLTPLIHGVHDNNNFIVREEFLTLAEHLKNYGYSTGAFVGAYVLDSRFGLCQGFDFYDDNYERSHRRKISTLERKAEDVVDHCLDWLRVQRSPWFIWIHCYDPHDPYDPPETFRNQYEENPYDGEVAYVDFILGKLLDYLKAHNLFEQSLIIFTGDHGESLGQHEEATHGFFAYNSTLWIPLIVTFPGLAKSTVSQYASHIDIFPTVCDILHIEKPSFLQGFSLLDLMKKDKLLKRLMYFESLYPYYSRGWAPIRGFLVGGEKFIDSPLPEIYDMDKDFDEIHNLAETKNLERYKKELNRFIEDQSSAGADRAERRLDRESLKKLRSLGYISSYQMAKKENFGPEDDVKVLLPYNNMATQAVELYRKGKVQEAIELLKKVFSESKSLDSAYSNLALLYEWEGRRKDSLEVLKLGLENIPSSYELFFNYVSFLIKADFFEEALRVFKDKSFPQMESDPELLNYLGLAYSRTGDLDKAIEIYEKALALDSQFPALHNNLGTAYLSLALEKKDSKVLRKSMESFKRAIELDPEYPLPYNSLGIAYRKAGNLEGAIYCWEKALKLNPDFGSVSYRLGLAYMDKKDYEKALYFLNGYYEKYSNSLSPKEKEQVEFLIKTCRTKLVKR
jgi:arylsulfatase A-like enzyme/Tfp pilus assembly protein PilF